MSHHLRLVPASTPEMLAVFADAAVIADALRFESELARASAAEGLFARELADEIVHGCEGIHLDAEALANEAALAGTLAIPLVAKLRDALESRDAARELHRGSTSQDVADTVMMLQAKRAAAILHRDLARVVAALTPLARRHADTAAAGRTLLQDAMPIAFGLRIAHWARAIADVRTRLAAEIAQSACLQLGGAVGTRAGLAGKGAAISHRLAKTLDLANSPPWHADRVGVAAIAAAVALVVGALGKMARDLSLLAQTAIGEAREPLVAGRGGSSSMPHKRNPTGCQIALAAAHRAPGLLEGIFSGLPAEEERGLGGWQAEGPALTELFLLAGGSAAAMAAVAEGLEIDPSAIARNGVGEDLGESAILVEALLQAGKDEA